MKINIIMRGKYMDIKLAKLMLKYITKVCNKHNGLDITKYSKLSDEVIYELEWLDY